MTGGNEEKTGHGLETRRLYFYDSYQVEFETEIIQRGEREGRPAVALEATCFYPEGGGQPCDLGEIEGVRVIKVIEEDCLVWHLLEKELSAEKRRLRGKIDWPRRYDHMQQHSGQHLLSQVCWELGRAETLSFHLGEEVSSIELDKESLSAEEEERIERRALELIFENRPVKTYFVSAEKAAAIPFRKKPVKTGKLRVVEIENYDFSACGGTHVRSTGEVGLLKIVGQDKVRRHVRLLFLAGFRAWQDYRRKNQVLERVAASFSVPYTQVELALDKLKKEARALRKKIQKTREELNEYEAGQLAAASSSGVITRLFEDRTAEEARSLALKIIHRGKFIVLFGIRGELQDHFILARSAEIPVDLTAWLPWLKETLQARGGGRESLIELVCPKQAPLTEAIKKIQEKIPPLI